MAELKKEFKTVEECLKAGYKWEDCMKLKVTDEGFRATIGQCPVVMKDEIKRKAFKGEPVIFRQEED